MKLFLSVAAVSGTITWWDMSHGWLASIARYQHVMRQGRFVADFAYFRGEDIPGCIAPCNLQQPMRPADFDSDAMNAEVLITRASVREGRLVLPDGMSYRYRVLPHDASWNVSPVVSVIGRHLFLSREIEMRRFLICYCLLPALLFFGRLPDARAEIHITKLGDSVVDANALTIQGDFGQCINGLAYQHDALATHKDHQYVAYYDANRRVCLARRRLPDGEWKVIRFDDYTFTSNDAHNTISLGVCPRDGTIHLAFDHHRHPLHYRVSQEGVAANPAGVAWEASLFGPLRSELEKGKPIAITYPRFWQTPNGGLQFCYRQGSSGNGDRMLVDYEPETGTWKNTRQIDSRAGVFEDHMGKSGSRCSYPNGYDYGPRGKLHVTWVWRESSQGANHDLMYSYSPDMGKTWHNNLGEPLPEPPGVNSPALKVVDISRAHGLINTHGQAVDSQGRIHVVMWHCTDESLEAAGSKPGQYRWGPPEARRYHHYWRDDDAAWHHVELPQVAGSRPKLFMDQADNAYLVYCDAWSREIFSLEGKLIIAAATADSRWTDWRIIHTEQGPFFNEMLGDEIRWKSQGVLSIMVQQSPTQVHEPTTLRIIDFSLNGTESTR